MYLSITASVTRPAHLKQCLCSCGWVGAIKSVKQVLKGTLTRLKGVSAFQYCPFVILEMTGSVKAKMHFVHLTREENFHVTGEGTFHVILFLTSSHMILNRSCMYDSARLLCLPAVWNQEQHLNNQSSPARGLLYLAEWHTLTKFWKNRFL